MADILKQITKLTKFKFCKKIIKYLKHKFELSSNDFNSFKQLILLFQEQLKILMLNLKMIRIETKKEIMKNI